MSLRSKTLRIAANLPKGNPTRRKLLTALTREDQDEVRNAAEEFAYSPFDYLPDEPYDIMDELLDGMGLKLTWSVYRDRPNMIAANMKNKGAPDWDQVFAKAAKKLGVPEDAIRSYGGGDRFWNELWRDSVEWFFEDDVKGNFPKLNVGVTGRSGGYWGFEADPSDLTAEHSEKEAAVRILQGMEEGEDPYDYITDNPRKFEDLVRFDPSVAKDIVKMDKMLSAESAYWEKPDRWVDLIEANNYYNED